MAYPAYMLRVIALAIITKTDAGLGTPEEFVTAYPIDDQTAILAEVYQMRPDLQPAQ